MNFWFQSVLGTLYSTMRCQEPIILYLLAFAVAVSTRLDTFCCPPSPAPCLIFDSTLQIRNLLQCRNGDAILMRDHAQSVSRFRRAPNVDRSQHRGARQPSASPADA